MATLDFTPMFRSTIGFDAIPRLLNEALEREESGYPPYNIEKTGEDTYRIVMAVAGFSRDDIELVQRNNRLTVRGKAKEPSERTFLHRGIAARSFSRDFDLADHVDVTDAQIDHGLLSITLVRKIPEALKPRTIAIGSAQPRAIADGAKTDARAA